MAQFCKHTRHHCPDWNDNIRYWICIGSIDKSALKQNGGEQGEDTRSLQNATENRRRHDSEFYTLNRTIDERTKNGDDPDKKCAESLLWLG